MPEAFDRNRVIRQCLATCPRQTEGRAFPTAETTTLLVCPRCARCSWLVDVPEEAILICTACRYIRI